MFYVSVSCGTVAGEGRRPSGQSLNSSVTHRPKRPGGGSSRPSASSASRAARISAVRASTAWRVGRPRCSIGLPTRTRMVLPKRNQPVPDRPTGTIGTPARKAKNATPSLIGSSARSPAWMRPSGAIARRAPLVEHAFDAAGRLQEIGMLGVVRDAAAGPGDEPVADADGHVGLTGTEEPEVRTGREAGHDDERIRPALVVEAEDRRTRGKCLALHADAHVGMHEQADPERGEPVRNPARPAERRPGCHQAGSRRGSRSASRAITKSAASAVPSPGGKLGFGTRTTVIPAARPASTPLRESSTTRQRVGRDPQPPGSLQVDVRGGLAGRDVVRGDDDPEALRQPDRAERGTDHCRIGRGCDRGGDRGRDPSGRLDGTGHARCRFASVLLDHGVHDGPLDLGGREVKPEPFLHDPSPIP